MDGICVASLIFKRGFGDTKCDRGGIKCLGSCGWAPCSGEDTQPSFPSQDVFLLRERERSSAERIDPSLVSLARKSRPGF